MDGHGFKKTSPGDVGTTVYCMCFLPVDGVPCGMEVLW